MRVALVHDVLNQIGGAEKVLESFLEIWPDAVIHTVFYDEQKTFGIFAKFNKQISWLNNFPFAHKHPKLFLPLIPLAFENFRFDDFDLVISDSSSFAKFAKSRGKMHISYIHTPTRFLWTEPDYVNQQRYPYVLKLAGKAILPLLRRWDFRGAQRPQFLIANSRNIQERITKYYHRDSTVIFPPADTEFFHPVGQKQKYFLVASRLEPYKKVDLVIEAFNELGWPLKVAGTGTNLEYLKSIAKDNIEFLGRISDEDLRRRYSEAQAFIFAAEEDAGIMVVEAQACGTPVIAYGKGGALETIVAGKTGEFFPSQTKESLISILQNLDFSKYDSQVIRAHAQQFDKKIFQTKIKQFVEERMSV